MTAYGTFPNTAASPEKLVRRLRQAGDGPIKFCYEAVPCGNFRLIDRLMAQVRRIKEINKLNTVTREVVDAARDCLVIGTS